MSFRQAIDKIIVDTATPIVENAVALSVNRINSSQPTMGTIVSISGGVANIRLTNGTYVQAMSNGNRPVGAGFAVSVIGNRFY